jgi:hypothetical protein
MQDLGSSGMIHMAQLVHCHLNKKKIFANETIPTLKEMLQLAMQRNVDVLFDIKAIDGHLCQGHPFENQYGDLVVETIINMSFPSDKMWWLYDKSVDIPTPFRKVSADTTASIDSLVSANTTTVNFNFDSLSWSHHITDYVQRNISVNIYVIDSSWLFSVAWCLGVSSITTNKCQELAKISRPVWHLTPEEFLAMWISVDIASVLIVIIIWVIQSQLHLDYNSSEKNILTRHDN